MLSMIFYRNLGFVLWIIAMISFGIFLLGKLGIKYMLIINASIIIIEMILLLLMIRKVFTADMLSARVLIPKGKFSDTQILANTYIFKEPIISTNPMKRGMFRIYIEIADKIIEPLEFSVIRMFEREVSEQKLDASHCFIESKCISKREIEF